MCGHFLWNLPLIEGLPGVCLPVQWSQDLLFFCFRKIAIKV